MHLSHLKTSSKHLYLLDKVLLKNMIFFYFFLVRFGRCFVNLTETARDMLNTCLMLSLSDADGGGLAECVMGRDSNGEGLILPLIGTATLCRNWRKCNLTFESEVYSIKLLSEKYYQKISNSAQSVAL